MARIPRIISQQTIPAVAPAVRLDPRRIGGTSAAFQSLIGTVQDIAVDFAEKEKRAEQAADLTRVNSESARQLSDLELSFEGDTDFATQRQRFNDGASGIRDTLRDTISDRAVRNSFDTKFEQLRLAKEINIRRGARRLQVDDAVAELDRSINSFADLAATAKNDVERQLLIQQAETAIDGAQEAGFITAVDAGVRARRFLSRLDEAQVRALTASDPGAAVEALLPGQKLFRNIDPLRRQTLFDTAIRQAIAQRKDRVRLAEKAERDAEKRQDAVGEEIAKEGFTLASEDALTNRWIDIHSDKLKLPDLRALLAIVTRASEPADDPEAVIDLIIHLDKEDITPAAVQYVRQNKLTTSTFRSITQRNRALRADDRPVSPFRAMLDFVRVSLDPGAFLSGAAAKIARIGAANAKIEAIVFKEANPQATLVEFMREARAIVDRFEILNFDEMSQALGLPRFFNGTRKTLTLDDLDDAERIAVKAFAEKRLTEAGLEQELSKLRNWRGVLLKQPTARPRDERPNPARPQ